MFHAAIHNFLTICYPTITSLIAHVCAFGSTVTQMKSNKLTSLHLHLDPINMENIFQFFQKLELSSQHMRQVHENNTSLNAMTSMRKT